MKDNFNILTNGSMEILDVTSEDEGTYYCTATNSQGNMTISAYLDVRSKSEMETMVVNSSLCFCVTSYAFIWLESREEDQVNGKIPFGPWPSEYHMDTISYLAYVNQFFQG